METIFMNDDVYKAALQGDSSKLEELAKSHPDMVLQISRSKEDTVLHVVVRSGDLSSAKFIKKIGEELIEKTNIQGNTALHIAARAGRMDLLLFLLEWAKEYCKAQHFEGDNENAILEKPNKNENTVLHEALGRKGNCEMVKRLVEIDPQLVNFGRESLLFMAANERLKDIEIECLKKNYACQKYRGPKRATLLHVAVARGHSISLVKLMAANKQEWVEEKDEDGRTPLHYAAYHDRPRAVSALSKTSKNSSVHTKDCNYNRENSSSIYTKDNNGDCPIHLAASRGFKCTVRMIKEFPDARDLLNIKRQNILHVAAKNGKSRLMEFLLSQPDSEILVNAEDEEGNTPLHLATSASHPKVVSLLTRFEGMDIRRLNKNGDTALDIAEANIETPTSFSKLMILATLRAAQSSDFEPVKVKYLANKTNNDNEKMQYYKDREKMQYYKDRVNTFVLVATLILTVTFAGGFTIPGGNRSDGPDGGIAIFLTKPAFYICVTCNTLAMYTSIVIVIVLMWAQTNNFESLAFALGICTPALGFALITMAIAFATGLFLVVSKLTWFAYFVLAITISFIFFIFALFFSLHVLLWSKSPKLLFMSRPLIRFVVDLLGD